MQNRVSLVPSDDLKLSEEVPSNLNIHTSLYSEEGNLVILGRLERGPLDRASIPGHIDIKVAARDGADLASVTISLRHLRTWRRGPRPVAFKAELPGMPPSGSAITVVYHQGPHD